MGNTALVLVDIQNDYFPSFRGSKMALPHMDAAANNAARLVEQARQSQIPVIHVRHVMTSTQAPFFLPDSEGSEIHPCVAPIQSETVVLKKRPNSFFQTSLSEELAGNKTRKLIICGAMSQMCVDATVRAAVDLGYEVTVAEDACAAANVNFNGVHVAAESVHASIMAPIAASYAAVKSTKEATQEMRLQQGVGPQIERRVLM